MPTHRPDARADAHHPERSRHYTSTAFGFGQREARVRPSTGSVGRGDDNAGAEAFFATLEGGQLDRRRLSSHAGGRMAAFGFVERACNPGRRPSALGRLSRIGCRARAMAESS